MSKYGAKKVVYDGITFDSKIESDYYKLLIEQKKRGEIKDFSVQPKFELLPKFEKNGKKFHAINYVADFKVIDNDDKVTVIDIKGMVLPLFSIKEKMFHHKYPYDLKLLNYTKIDGWVELGELKKNRKERKKLKEIEDAKKAEAQRLREEKFMKDHDLNKIESIIDGNIPTKPRFKEYLLRYIKENFSTINDLLECDDQKLSKSYRKKIVEIKTIMMGEY